MTIYTASLFEPAHHHGRRVAVCRSLPPGAVVDRHLKFLAPPARLLWDYKQWQSQSEVTLDRLEEYKQRYWQHLMSVWDQLFDYMEALPKQETETWLCWEAAGKFCHRNLLLKLIERDWPQQVGLGGGADVPFEVAEPGIAEACERFGLKPTFHPVVPAAPARAAAHLQSTAVQPDESSTARSQLIVFPTVQSSSVNDSQ